jgi:hypothetical protein
MGDPATLAEMKTMGTARNLVPWAAAVTASALLPLAAWALDPTLPHPGHRPTGSPTAQPPGSPSQLPTPAADDPTVPPAERLPVPDAAALQQAGKLIDQVYREPIAAAKTVEQKRALGQQFLRKAVETTSDPAGKFVLMTRARDVAADAGDADTCLAALLGAERAFAVEPGSADLDAAGRLAKSLRGVEPHRTLARYLMGSANEAVAAEKFDAARRLADMAQYAAGKANDPPLAKATATRAKEIREVEAAYVAAKPALAAAAKGPADADQSLAAGRFKCFYKGDWAAGLPLLAAGADASLKELAARDLAKPSGADQQLAVADAWWAEAGKAQGVARNLTMAHARGLYQQVEPTLAGLPKDKAAARAKEADALAALYAPRSGWVRLPQPAGVPTAGPPTAGSASAGTPSAGAPATTSPPTAPPLKPAAPAPPSGPAAVVRPGSPIKLPSQFTREWKSPPAWVGRPEQVAIAAGKATIVNEGGSNSVCKDEAFAVLKDGSLALQWDYGPMKAGYEIWKIEGGALVIHRWNSKADKDSGQPVRRVGSIAAQ